MKSDYKCKVKTFLHEMLTLGIQLTQMEVGMLIDRKLGIEPPGEGYSFPRHPLRANFFLASCKYMNYSFKE
jgi:hypothetical protein